MPAQTKLPEDPAKTKPEPKRSPSRRPRPPPTRLPDDPDALVDLRQVIAVIPVTRMTLWRWEKKELFPKRINLHNGRIYWRAAAVRAWLKDRAG